MNDIDIIMELRPIWNNILEEIITEVKNTNEAINKIPSVVRLFRISKLKNADMSIHISINEDDDDYIELRFNEVVGGIYYFKTIDDLRNNKELYGELANFVLQSFIAKSDSKKLEDKRLQNVLNELNQYTPLNDEDKDVAWTIVYYPSKLKPSISNATWHICDCYFTKNDAVGICQILLDNNITKTEYKKILKYVNWEVM